MSNDNDGGDNGDNTDSGFSGSGVEEQIELELVHKGDVLKVFNAFYRDDAYVMWICFMVLYQCMLVLLLV